MFDPRHAIGPPAAVAASATTDHHKTSVVSTIASTS